MTSWSMRPAPDSDAEIGRWRLDKPVQLQQLRIALRDVLATASTAETAVQASDLAERVLVVATELAGNALRHGGPPVFVALRADGHVVVDVADSAAGTLPSVDRHRPAGDGGLGLQLAEKLAEEVGWYPTPTGKHVWAAFSTPPKKRMEGALAQ
jgi:serine/threonine-protein kinase RsbW